MPSYTFRDKESGEEFEHFVKMAELEDFLARNPHIEQCVQCPAISYTAITPKPDEGFRDVLREIKKKHYKSTININ